MRYLAAAAVLVMSVFTADAFVSVSPPVVELLLKPGQKINGQLTVSNPKSETVIVNMEVKEWWKEQSGLPGLPIEQWLFLKTMKPFKLKPNQSRVVKFKAVMPESFSGEAMAMVFFNIDSNNEAGQMNLQLRHGIPIYVVAENTGEAKPEIRQVSAYFVNNSTSALEFSVLLGNSGNLHFRPKGTITITSEGQVIEIDPIEYGWPLFPGQTHSYASKTKVNNWTKGDYKAEIAIDCGGGFPIKDALVIKKNVPFTISSQGKIELLN